MRKLFPLTAFLAVCVLSVPMFAQDQAPSAGAATGSPQTQPGNTQPDQSAQMQQVRSIFQDLIQKMIARGISPGTFFQQMQNGVDPADIQKQLIDQGLIDQKTLDQLQSAMMSMVAGRIRAGMDVTDDEWQVIWPMIQKVMAASAAVNGTRSGNGMAAFFTRQTKVEADLAKAKRALVAATADTSTSGNRIATLLHDFREAHEKARDELDVAQEQLISTLTVRQEASLAAMGIIE
jgi:hypothetical protein